MVVSVRSARPSLWYCLILVCLYCAYSDGTTPSVSTRVETTGRPFGHSPIEDQLHLIGPANIQVLANYFFKELTSRAGKVEYLCQ
jgi:hypothetical protein